MIDKTPKITDEDNENRSSIDKKIGKEYVEKIRKMLSGELRFPDTEKKEEDAMLPEPQETESEEEKEKSKLVDGGTWHNKYDNY